MSLGNRFYTVPRHPDELPLRTRIQVSGALQLPSFAGRYGNVVGYRCAPGGIIPTGWHYIQFDGDATVYPGDEDQPYVHRQYLEVVL